MPGENGEPVYGCKISSKVAGYTDQYIFLPSTGKFNGSEVSDVGSKGYYWTSSLNLRIDENYGGGVINPAPKTRAQEFNYSSMLSSMTYCSRCEETTRYFRTEEDRYVGMTIHCSHS